MTKHPRAMNIPYYPKDSVIKSLALDNIDFYSTCICFGDNVYF